MPYPTPAGSVSELVAALDGIAHVDGDRLVIDDEPRFRDEGVRAAVWSATFSADKDVVEAARWIIWEASQVLGARSASIHELYMARGRGEIHGFTVPACNLRTQVFDMALTMCRAAQPTDVGTLDLRAGPERAGVHVPAAGRVHHERPGRMHRGRLARARSSCRATTTSSTRPSTRRIQMRRPRPFARRRGTRWQSATATSMSTRRRSSISPCPTSTPSSAPTTSAPQRSRRLIREVQPPDLMVSIGGEIGEVGKQNSTEEELRAYLDGYFRELERRAGPGVPGISKVSVQTGTSHGGVPLPAGGVAEVKLDFGTLERLGEVARSYGLAGAVQHGASTLPDELFHRFPAVETAEIHLATGLPELPFTSIRRSPRTCSRTSRRGASRNTLDERKPDDDDIQFLYKTRKKALGPYKRQLWELPTKDEILADQQKKIEFLFDQLKVARHQGVRGASSSIALERHQPDAGVPDRRGCHTGVIAARWID